MLQKGISFWKTAWLNRLKAEFSIYFTHPDSLYWLGPSYYVLPGAKAAIGLFLYFCYFGIAAFGETLYTSYCKPYSLAFLHTLCHVHHPQVGWFGK